MVPKVSDGADDWKTEIEDAYPYMKVELLPNKGPASLGAEIVARLGWAERVDMASAFVTSAGVRMLQVGLGRDRKDSKPRVRLVVGTYSHFTEPAVFRELLRLHNNDPVGFQIRVARNLRFHWKFYRFGKGAEDYLYVGSGNLTKDGLKASGELAIRIRATTRDSISEALQHEFDDLWAEENSFKLESRFIDDYGHDRKPPSNGWINKTSGRLSRWLRPPTRPPETPAIANEGPNARPRILFVDEFLTDETVEFLELQTNWGKNHWTYTCFPYKQDFTNIKNAGLILFVERSEGRGSRKYLIEFSCVRDSVEIETNEGKYFVAHSRVPYGRCVDYDKVKEKLAKVGLSFKKIKADATIDRPQMQSLSQLLHIRPERLHSA